VVAKAVGHALSDHCGEVDASTCKRAARGGQLHNVASAQLPSYALLQPTSPPQPSASDLHQRTPAMPPQRAHPPAGSCLSMAALKAAACSSPILEGGTACQVMLNWAARSVPAGAAGATSLAPEPSAWHNRGEGGAWGVSDCRVRGKQPPRCGPQVQRARA